MITTFVKPVGIFTIPQTLSSFIALRLAVFILITLSVTRNVKQHSALGRRKMHPKASNFLALLKPDHAAVLDLS